MLNLHQLVAGPVRIASIEALHYERRYLVRATSIDGAQGIVTVNDRLRYLWPILREFVVPVYVGKDARDLETLVDEVYTARSAYKLAGIALWNCVAYVELSLLDLLGNLVHRSVSQLVGPVLRPQIPIYLSSTGRDTTPEEETAWLAERLAQTGARAVKFKIGGRMSHNADASPGRSERLVALARKTFGDEITLYVDANGSYDADHAIALGPLLEEYGVAFLEEPCPWEEIEQTKQVADALALPVAGGEQDSSLPHFSRMIRNHVIDLVQPDVMYCGGFVRCLRIAQMAEAAGMQIMPHSPKLGAESAAVLHFGAVARNLGPHQEYQAKASAPEPWYTPSFEISNGSVAVPSGPGLGVCYDPAVLAQAEPLFT